MPELVNELDGMIAGHLMDTNTPLPPPNPNFQPDAVNPITGKGTPPKAQPAAKTAAGWNASGTTAGVKRDGGHPLVNSTGKDPFIATQAVPKSVGPVIGRARIKLSTSGDGQMFWASKSKPGFAGKFVDFNLLHDGRWHEYEVTLPVVGELSGFRLDPGRGEGEIRTDWIGLVSPDGTTLKRWDF